MSYAKAIYPYQTGVTGDLELQIDDIIEVKNKSNGHSSHELYK
jgi:hypothetical protein